MVAILALLGEGKCEKANATIIDTQCDEMGFSALGLFA
jgi:hypothetical protein